LGYYAECYIEVISNIGSFAVAVQSEKFPPDVLLKSVNHFLKNTYNYLIMSPSFKNRFKDAVNVLKTSLSDEEKSHERLTDHTWGQIISAKYQFDIKEQKLHLLKEISVETFQTLYYKNILNERERRKLTVVVYGEGKETKLNVDCEIIFDKIDQTKTDLSSSCK